MNTELLEILYKRSFRYDPDHGFKLSSGGTSDVYIDVKKTVLSSDGIMLTGKALFEKIKDDKIDGIGGLTLGADPLAYTAAYTANLNGKPLNVFIVRKEPKKHGTQRAIEGSLEKGARVVVVDDVITTGGATVKAIESVLAAGFTVVKAVVLVDRQEGGRENIERFCPVESVFTKADLLGLRGKINS